MHRRLCLAEIDAVDWVRHVDMTMYSGEVVTHDEKIIPTFKRIYHIRDGKTYEEAGEGRPL